MSDLFSQPFEDDRQTPPPAERRVVTVSELTAKIRGLLESGFGDVWVEGEISNCKIWNTGHMYFTLKDGGAQIKAVMFRSAVRYLKFKAEDGLHVIARGRIGVYEPKGEYQILCEHLQPQGLGALQLAFEQLKKKLQAEGLFDASRKRPLPALPRQDRDRDVARRCGACATSSRCSPAAIPTLTSSSGRRACRATAPPPRSPTPSAPSPACRRRGRHRRARRRRIGRGSRGLQPGAGRAGDCRLSRAGRHRGRTRSGLHDRRLRRRRPRTDAVGRRGNRDRGAKEEFCARIDRQSRRLRAAMSAGLDRRRDASPRAQQPPRAGGLARPARACAAGTPRSSRTSCGASSSTPLTRREREFRALRLRLEARDLRRRFAAIRARLDSRDRTAARRHRPPARSRRRAARPVCRPSRVVEPARGSRPRLRGLLERRSHRDSSDGARRSPRATRVHVTLHDGELTCVVESTDRTVDEPFGPSGCTDTAVISWPLTTTTHSRLKSRWTQRSRTSNPRSRSSTPSSRRSRKATSRSRNRSSSTSAACSWRGSAMRSSKAPSGASRLLNERGEHQRGAVLARPRRRTPAGTK